MQAGEFAATDVTRLSVVSAGTRPRRCLAVTRSADDAARLAQALPAVQDDCELSSASNGLDALRMVAEQQYDVLVVDLLLPDMDGYSVAYRTCHAARAAGLPEPAVLLRIGATMEPFALSGLNAPAMLVSAEMPVELLAVLVTQELRGRTDARVEAPAARVEAPAARVEAPAAGAVRLVPREAGVPERRADRQHRPTVSTLSEREREVLTSLCRGGTNRQLARTLCVSETTVKTHVSSLLSKLGLSSRLEAVVFAYENGIVQPGGDHSTHRSGAIAACL